MRVQFGVEERLELFGEFTNLRDLCFGRRLGLPWDYDSLRPRHSRLEILVCEGLHRE